MLDLVLVQHQDGGQKFLFQAPYHSDLNTGNEVIVETRRGRQKATVVSSLSVNDENDIDRKTIDFILKTTGAMMPLKKILSRTVEEPFLYRNDPFLHAPSLFSNASDLFDE